MEKVTIAIVYHSRGGNTERLARLLVREMTTNLSEVRLVNVANGQRPGDLLTAELFARRIVQVTVHYMGRQRENVIQ